MRSWNLFPSQPVFYVTILSTECSNWDKRWPLGISLVALLYLGAAQGGLALAVVHGNVTAVWPPSGLALAALLLFGLRYWPGVFLGAFAVNWLTGVSPLACTLIAIGNTAECLIGAYLIQRWCQDNPPFSRVSDTLKFVLVGALFATTIAAGIGAGSLIITGAAAKGLFADLFLTWWLGDATGMLVFTPLIVTWLLQPNPGWGLERTAELLLLSLCTVALSYLVFGGSPVFDHIHHPIAFVILPAVIWAALRFGTHGAATSIFMISLIAIWGTAQGAGPFVQSNLNESLLLLQGFIGLSAIMSMILCATVSEREYAEARLHESQKNLERRVLERTKELADTNTILQESEQRLSMAQRIAHMGNWDWDLASNAIYWSDEIYRILGLVPQSSDISYDMFINAIHADDVALVKSTMSKTLDQRLPYNLIHRVLLPNGDQRVVRVQGEVTHDRANNPLRMVGTLQDITEEHAAQDKLRQAATVFETTADGVLITDRDINIVAVNKAFCKITGYNEHEVLGKNPRILQSGRHDADFYENLMSTLKSKGKWQGEIWDRRRDGSVYPKWQTISSVTDEAGRLTHYVGVFSDTSAIKQSEEKLQHLVHHDALTDLPNRLLLNARLRHALQLAHRENQQIAVLFLDLDRFKNINDTLGHPLGDRLLELVAKRLRLCVREEDTLARLGGDEFVMVLERHNDSRHAAALAQEVLDELAKPIELNGHDVFITASVGISIYPQDGRDETSLLKNADAAMYMAKNQGRNGYQFYTKELTRTAFESLTLESKLHRALERDEFVLHYQPQVCLHSGALVGVEALVRWQHPQMGLVAPDRFIPLAEENGLIESIGQWVLQSACAQARAWQDEGLGPLRMAVNLSARQIMQDDIVSRIADTLLSCGLNPSYLELEITEGSVMNHAQRAVATLDALRKLGVAVAIDDFGTGYSSLSYLKRFSVDRLKIDRSFVRDIPRDSNDVALAKAIIALGTSLNLRVIAEGVETVEQKNVLSAMGCHEMQGFLYSKPLPAEQLRALLIKERHTPRAAEHTHDQRTGTPTLSIASGREKFK